jgi:hypothetical protein
MLREPPPKPLDPVEKKLPLLVVQEFVVEALSGLAEDGAPGLVAYLPLQPFLYTSCCHQDLRSWWSGLGVCGAPPGPFLYLTPQVHFYCTRNITILYLVSTQY